MTKRCDKRSSFLWEAADRICGKRLKAVLPGLVAALERHDHLNLDAEVRQRVLAVSAATIDRLLAPVRNNTSRRKKRKAATKPSKEIPVRTFADYGEPGLRPATEVGVHTLAGLPEERPSLDRAEEWCGRAALRRLSASRRDGSGTGPRSAVPGRAAVRELLPALDEVAFQDPRGSQG